MGTMNQKTLKSLSDRVASLTPFRAKQAGDE